jgi:hypothetical protein
MPMAIGPAEVLAQDHLQVRSRRGTRFEIGLAACRSAAPPSNEAPRWLANQASARTATQTD